MRFCLDEEKKKKKKNVFESRKIFRLARFDEEQWERRDRIGKIGRESHKFLYLGKVQVLHRIDEELGINRG